MAGEIEEPVRLNFQADLLQSGSISFGRFESESLSWERRSIFPHNRYLEEVEKYSKPGSVTEKKAYFEAEFRRKALLKQRSSECQDGGESPTVTNSEMYAFEDYGNFNDGPCGSNASKRNTETEIPGHEKGDIACFDESTSDIVYDEDTTSQHLESQSQNELGETHQSENENVAGNTEQSVELTHVNHAVLVDVSSVANDDSSLACQTSKKDNGSISISISPLTTSSPKVKPAAEKKLTRSTVKTQVNADWFQKQVLNGGSKGSMKPRTSESKDLPVKKTEKKSPRPASPLIRSGVKSLKAEELKSEKAVKGQFPLSKSLPGVRPIVNRTKATVNSSKIHIGQSATGFSFKTDQRAENRKQFYTKIAEKMHAKEVEINQVEAKTLEKQAAEMKQFRKSLNFKAKPLPSFYNESACVSDQHKVTPINKTPNQPRPRSQAMAARHDRNLLKSSIPLNIRLSSSTSSTNRICISESVGRNHASANIDKGKDKKLNKQKDLETRGRDVVKRHVKGIHTWHGPKVGIVS
ncbi:hypothetical protein R6Q57_024706 [Mikania cordata]